MSEIRINDQQQVFASYEGQEQFLNPVRMSFTHREVKVHSLTDPELDSIASLSSSVDLTFLGICGGAFVTLLVTVLTVQIQSSKTFAAFISATFVAGVFTLFFGVRARGSYKDAQEKLNEIRSGTKTNP